MLLCIDVGNTKMAFGLYREEKLVGAFRLKTDGDRSEDEVGLLICQYLQRFQFPIEELEGVIIATVVPGVMEALEGAVEKYLGQKALVVDRDIDSTLVMGIESNERLGADRAAACVAARELYGCPCIVLDLGTATTLDALDETGAYMGGCITAGMGLMADALTGGTALLPRIDLVRPERVLNSTSVGHMQAGLVIGYVGAMEYLVCQAQRELGVESCPVIATGGMAKTLAAGSSLIRSVDTDLVLEGLRLIYGKYKAGK